MNNSFPERLGSLPEDQQRALFMYALARARHARSLRHALLATLVVTAGSYLIRHLMGADSDDFELTLLKVSEFLGIAAILLGGLTATFMTVTVGRMRRQAVDSGLPKDLIELVTEAPASWLEQRF